MLKSELIAKISKKHINLKASDVEFVVDNIFNNITDHLANGGRVEWRSFGTFSIKQRDARIGRNPANNEKVKIEAKNVVKFNISKKLHELLNSLS